MRRWISFAALFSCAALLTSGCDQDKGAVVAEVLGHKISSAEFRERYEKYLDLTSERDNIRTREKVLGNMINERLILDDVHRQGLDEDATCKEKSREIEGQALLDAYARSVSVDTLTVSESELWQEFRAYNSKVTARFLYAKTEQEAHRLKDSIEHGASFDQLAKGIFEDPGLANSGGSLGTFGWGEMDPELEQVAFTIPVGSVSDPVKLKMGYSIVKVEHRVEMPLASVADYAKVRQKLERAVIERKTSHLVKHVADEVAGDLAPEFNPSAIDLVLRNWSFEVDETAPSSSIEPRSSLSSDVTSVKMISFKNGESWTVGEFMQKALTARLVHRKRVKTVDDVKDLATGLMTRDVLLERARKEGLQDDDKVQDQIRKYKEAWLLERWAKSVQDTVGNSGWNDDSLRAIYETNPKEYVDPPMVDVAEILVRTRSEADAIRKKLNHGADFQNLAREHSIRPWARTRGGDLGYGTKASFGILGDRFFKTKVHQVIGPEAVSPYFGVFKILGKKEARQRTFEHSREDIIKSLLPMKKRDVFASVVQNLRTHMNFTQDLVALGNVVVEHK